LDLEAKAKATATAKTTTDIPVDKRLQTADIQTHPSCPLAGDMRVGTIAIREHPKNNDKSTTTIP
jgi:hypothetical protein